VTILERIRTEGRTFDLGRLATALRMDLPILRTDALEAVERVGQEIKLEERVDDVVKRVRREMPAERIAALVARLERDLPTTDTDRYDRAFSRGWTRARTTFVGVGLLAGVAAGIVGAFLLDPARGEQRRAEIAARAMRARADATSQARRGAAIASERARGIATQRGLIKPAATDGVTTEVPVPGANVPEAVIEAAPAPLIGVMDIPAVAEPDPSPVAAGAHD